MAAQEDLSGDSKLTRLQSEALKGDIDEEKERRRWKTRFLRIAAILIVVLYLLFFAFVLNRICSKDLGHAEVLFAVVLASAPTILAIHFFRVIGRRNQQPEEPTSNPWLLLAKEAIDAFKQRH